MKTLIKSIKIIHFLLLFFLMLTLALLPLLTDAGLIVNFVYLPLCFVLLGIISINIENKLNKCEQLINQQQSLLNLKKCRIYQGLCCLHS